MYRITQLIRNSFVRLEGLLYQLFSFFRKLFDQLKRLFNFLSRLLGFTDSQYFLEADSTQGIKKAEASPDMSAKASQYSPPAASATRQSRDANRDYFLNMAQQMARQKKTSS